MLLNPAIMALILVSFVVLLMLLVAAGFAIHLLRFWDMASGSERQLRLERRTYLISTLLAGHLPPNWFPCCSMSITPNPCLASSSVPCAPPGYSMSMPGVGRHCF